MGQLQDVHKEILELGYQVVAISPDGPEGIKKLEGKSGYELTLLSDPGLAASRALGIVFAMDEKTEERYEGFGVPLTRVEGDDRALMPVPAIFIVDKERKVRFQYVDPNFTTRIDPQLLLAAARAAKK